MSQNHGGWIVRFGVYEANLHSGELRKQGARIKLQEQPFQVLAMLLEKPGEIVTREEMRQRLWPQDTFVDFDHSLNKAINKIRDALCDSAENPHFVETLARRGYRFLAPVHFLDPEGIHHEKASPTPHQNGTESPADQAGPDPITINATLEQEPPRIVAEPAANPLPWWRKHIWTVVLFGLLVLASAAYLFRPEMPAPRIARVVQLTNDGMEKESLNWGGSKLFFVMLRGGIYRIFQMPDQGGTPQDISHLFSEKVFYYEIWDASNDGNRLLLTCLEEATFSTESEVPVWTFDFPNQSLQRLGNLKGHRFRWSPDGKKIAFTQGRDLYVAEGDGSQLKKVFSFKNNATLLRWYPDGKTLRITSPPDWAYFVVQWEIGLDGAGLRQVMPSWKSWQGNGDFTWDGKYFIFFSDRNLGPGRREFWAHNEIADFFHRQRQEPIQLTIGPDLLGWPAASKIAPVFFAQGIKRRGEMMRIDLKSGRRIPFLGGISADCLDFSKDGEWVVYVTYPEFEMWRSRKDGSEKLKLTAKPNLSYIPRWSPDGTKITFCYLQPGKLWKIAIIPRDGGEPEILIPDASTEFDPNWSPDGTKIVYAPYPPKQAEGKVWILDLNTRQRTEIPGSQGLYSPRWSPDGKYLSALNAELRLKLYEIKTSHWTEWVPPGCSFPNWSRDGKFIQVIQAREPELGICRAWIADGKVERIVNLREIKMVGNIGNWVGMTPEGDPLILESRGSNEIYAYHLEY
jgi:Tol biopolymer transport system component/DNA-binding winged helix-turn-helix (wHTH) protein